MRILLWLLIIGVVAIVLPLGTATRRSPACCPAGPRGQPVVNADQTVIMIWDAEKKTQHFIRQASFRSESSDFGFLVPTPTEPELNESGNNAFTFLTTVTAPEIRTIRAPGGGMSCGCGVAPAMRAMDKEANHVEVLQEKRVAGFDVKVLEATSAPALVAWLNERGYDFSDAVATWAEPYIQQGWKITALKVAADGSANAKATPARGTSSGFEIPALRISFQTERPLFPYREPDPAPGAKELGVASRMLRIFFVADGRFRGELTEQNPWTGQVAWAGRMNEAARAKLLEQLKLPAETGPREFWLTEFEDLWPYQAAPADLYFSRDDVQQEVRRPPLELYVRASGSGDVTVVALALFGAGMTFWRRRKPLPATKR